eukprot:sb/3477630/
MRLTKSSRYQTVYLNSLFETNSCRCQRTTALELALELGKKVSSHQISTRTKIKLKHETSTCVTACMPTGEWRLQSLANAAVPRCGVEHMRGLQRIPTAKRIPKKVQ